MKDGDLLGDSYTVIKRIGSGGQASVYLVIKINTLFKSFSKSFLYFVVFH